MPHQLNKKKKKVRQVYREDSIGRWKYRRLRGRAYNQTSWWQLLTGANPGMINCWQRPKTKALDRELAVENVALIRCNTSNTGQWSIWCQRALWGQISQNTKLPVQALRKHYIVGIDAFGFHETTLEQREHQRKQFFEGWGFGKREINGRL